jgi:hypothetical protein
LQTIQAQFCVSTRTYNAVVLCSSEVKVFRFGDNIWRKIASFTPYNLVDTLGCSYVNQGVHLSGTVNWISFYPKDVSVEKFVTISLDLGTEKSIYTRLFTRAAARAIYSSKHYLHFLLKNIGVIYHKV